MTREELIKVLFMLYLARNRCEDRRDDFNEVIDLIEKELFQ